VLVGLDIKPPLTLDLMSETNYRARQPLPLAAEPAGEGDVHILRLYTGTTHAEGPLLILKLCSQKNATSHCTILDNRYFARDTHANANRKSGYSRQPS